MALLHVYLVLLPVHLKHGDVALPVDLIPRWVLPHALCLDATQRAGVAGFRHTKKNKKSIGI